MYALDIDDLDHALVVPTVSDTLLGKAADKSATEDSFALISIYTFLNKARKSCAQEAVGAWNLSMISQEGS